MSLPSFTVARQVIEPAVLDAIAHGRASISRMDVVDYWAARGRAVDPHRATMLLQSYKAKQEPGVTPFILGKPGYGHGARFPVVQPDQFTTEVRKGVTDGLKRVRVDLECRAATAAAQDPATAQRYADAAQVLDGALQIITVALNSVVPENAP